MAANTYDVGDLVRVAVRFKTPQGTAVDPTTVTVKTKNPAGTTTTKVYGTDAEVVKDSTGSYYYDVSVSTAGTWYYRWTGTGTYQGASETSIIVRATQF